MKGIVLKNMVASVSVMIISSWTSLDIKFLPPSEKCDQLLSSFTCMWHISLLEVTSTDWGFIWLSKQTTRKAQSTLRTSGNAIEESLCCRLSTSLRCATVIPVKIRRAQVINWATNWFLVIFFISEDFRTKKTPLRRDYAVKGEIKPLLVFANLSRCSLYWLWSNT